MTRQGKSATKVLRVPTEVAKHTREARGSTRSSARPEESRGGGEGRGVTEAGSDEDRAQHCGGGDGFHVAVVTNELSLVYYRKFQYKMGMNSAL